MIMKPISYIPDRPAFRRRVYFALTNSIGRILRFLSLATLCWAVAFALIFVGSCLVMGGVALTLPPVDNVLLRLLIASYRVAQEWYKYGGLVLFVLLLKNF